MKKILTLATVALFAINMNAQEIKFEQEVIDYGKIKLGSDGNRVFKFKNTGDAPLEIKSASASCGCTVPQTPKKPIFPGQTGEIKVHYDTNRPGNFSKPITVHSNAKNGERKMLTIKGYIAN